MAFKSKYSGCTEALKAISDKSRSTLLSHHLSILRQQGLILSERHGKSVLCKINPKIKIRGKNKGLDLGKCKITLIPGRR
jgi:DNA-binding transcriptional ArsR family regulator